MHQKHLGGRVQVGLTIHRAVDRMMIDLVDRHAASATFTAAAAQRLDTTQPFAFGDHFNGAIPDRRVDGKPILVVVIPHTNRFLECFKAFDAGGDGDFEMSVQRRSQ
jgi:hypothetical protein